MTTKLTLVLTMALIVTSCTNSTALMNSKAQPVSIERRVAEAKLVFTGKLINKKIKGEWVEAEIHVEQAIRGVKKGQKIPVIWRASINGRPIYNAAEDTRGIAILKDKNKDRYWLRADRFEMLKLKDQVIKANKLPVNKATKE